MAQIIHMTHQIRGALLFATNADLELDKYLLDDIVEMLQTIPEGQLLQSELGPVDAEGNVVNLEEEPEDFVSHPVTLMERYGITG